MNATHPQISQFMCHIAWGSSGARVHTGNETTAVRDGELHGRRRGAFVVTGRVVGVPDQDARYTGVHAGRHQKGHAVLNFRVVDVRDHRVPDDGYGEREEHDHASELHAIGHDRHDDLVWTPVSFILPLGRTHGLPVKTVATAYGMTDHSCAELAFFVNPLLMIVGS